MSQEEVSEILTAEDKRVNRSIMSRVSFVPTPEPNLSAMPFIGSTISK
jgi:hypothetical protein